MSAKEDAAFGGVGLGGLTFLVFLVLKLLGKFDHSWLVVTAPLWGPLVFAVGLMIAIAVVALLIAGVVILLERAR